MTSRPGSDRPGTDGGGPDRPASDRDGDSPATPAAGSSSSGTPSSGNAAVDRIVERFGGIRPMANKLDTPVTTVQGWKKRGAIPLARHADLRAAAAKHRIKLNDADLDAATPSEDRVATDGDAVSVPAPDARPADSVPGATSGTPVAGAADAGAAAPDALIPPATPIAASAGTGAPIESASPDAKDAADTPPLDPNAPAAAMAEEKVAEKQMAAGKADEKTAGKADEKAAGAPVNEPPADDRSATETATPWSGGSAADREPARPTIAPTPAYVDEPRSGAGFATALSVVALLVGAAALAEPWWGPNLAGWPAGGSAPAANTSAPADPALRAQLEQQIRQLTDRIGTLEQRPAVADAAANGAAVSDTSGLQDKVASLSERIDALEKQPTANPADAAAARKDLSDRIGGMEQKLSAVADNSQATQDLRGELDSLKQQLSGVSQTVQQRQDAATTAQALVLAAGQLRSALAAGQPFQPELQAVRALNVADSGVTQPLDSVAAYAAKGVPTRGALTDRFQPLAGEIVRAEARGPGASWIDQVRCGEQRS